MEELSRIDDGLFYVEDIAGKAQVYQTYFPSGDWDSF